MLRTRNFACNPSKSTSLCLARRRKLLASTAVGTAKPTSKKHKSWVSKMWGLLRLAKPSGRCQKKCLHFVPLQCLNLGKGALIKTPTQMAASRAGAYRPRVRLQAVASDTASLLNPMSQSSRALDRPWACKAAVDVCSPATWGLHLPTPRAPTHSPLPNRSAEPRNFSKTRPRGVRPSAARLRRKRVQGVPQVRDLSPRVLKSQMRVV